MPDYLSDNDFLIYLQHVPDAMGTWFPQDVRCPYCYFGQLVWFPTPIVPVVVVVCPWCWRSADQNPIQPVADDDIW